MMQRVNFSKIEPYVLTSISAWVSRVVTTLCAVFSVRLLIDGLGPDSFAAYSVIISLAGWYGLLDFGAPTSSQNYISESRALNKQGDEFITPLFIILFCTTVVALTLVLICGPYFAKWLLENFNFLSEYQRYISFTIFGVCAILLTMGSAVYRVWYAEQVGYFVHILQTLSTITSVTLIFLVFNSAVHDKFVWSIIASQLPMVLFPLIAWLVLVRKTWRFNLNLTKKNIKLILRRAFSMWLFSIASVIVLQMDLIILSQFMKGESIAIYALCSKIFLVAALAYNAVLQAYWPVCAELSMRGEWRKIYRFIIRYLYLSFGLIIFITIIFSIFRVEITNFFSPAKIIELPVALIFTFGLSYLVRAWTDIFAVILQSMSQLNTLLIFAIIQAFINILIQITLVPIIGLYGSLIGVTLSFLLTVSWALPIKVLYFSRQIKKVL